MKKKVIAYLHTHWDREWYREFEVFRLRLLRVFDNVLEMLENKSIPSFYFDGQVVALLDYLEIRPEKEAQIRKFIAQKKLFIGPFYCLVDEFLTDKSSFEKNLEIGLKISKDFGCEDFVGYLADTFGHSKNVPIILQKFGIDKAIVWRGVGNLPANFLFNGVKTVNLVRGYYMDVFSNSISIKEKANLLKKDFDKISEKASNYLLLPIGADHLGVEKNISNQIANVNKYLSNYEIKLGSPFDYFEKTEFKTQYNDELRDNSKTFILQGAYSARMKLKQYNVKCTYMLEQTDKLQKFYGNKYETIMDYAYKLLLQNQAHDSICGCSTDSVYSETVNRYEKIIQITTTIIEELRLEHHFNTPVMQTTEPIVGYDILKAEHGFENKILYDTQKIPTTEDYKIIYTIKKSPQNLTGTNITVNDGKLFVGNIQVEFVIRKDKGDSYNFGAVKGDYGKKAEIFGLGKNIIKTSFFDVEFYPSENLINFKIEWNNKFRNKLWQVKFLLPNPITETFSEDMNTIIRREFNPDYDLLKHLPEKRGLEAKTNFAPMQRLVWAQGVGIITKGLTEYEVFGNGLSITLLRSIGIISNPHNPSRTTPAGPPIKVPKAQQLGKNSAEFSVGFFDVNGYQKYIDEVFPSFV